MYYNLSFLFFFFFKSNRQSEIKSLYFSSDLQPTQNVGSPYFQQSIYVYK